MAGKKLEVYLVQANITAWVDGSAEYFNDSRISNSDLGLIRRDPWGFWLTKNKKIDKPIFDHFELGTLIHLSVLEPEKFSVADINKPGGLMGAFLDIYIEAGCTDEAAKYAHDKVGFKLSLETIKEKLKEKENKKYIDFMKKSSDKLVLTGSQKYVVDRAFQGIQMNPKAMEYLMEKHPNCEYFNELSLFGSIVLSNGTVAIKGKPDRLIINHKDKTIKVIDLKSTSSSPWFETAEVSHTGNPLVDVVGTEFFSSFKNFGYYRQCAFYNQLVRQNFPEICTKYKISNHIIPVNTKDSFSCSVINVTEKWTDAGYNEMMDLLYVYNRHKQSGDWKSNFYIETTNGEIIL